MSGNGVFFKDFPNFPDYPHFFLEISAKNRFPGTLNRKSQANFGKIRFSEKLFRKFWAHKGPNLDPLWVQKSPEMFLEFSKIFRIFQIFSGNFCEKSRKNPGNFIDFIDFPGNSQIFRGLLIGDQRKTPGQK